MRLRILTAVLAVCGGAPFVGAQGNGKAPEPRTILGQILAQTYQPAEVGKGLMGVGSETGVKRPGTIVVTQREGLWGSLLRNEIASSSVHGLKAELYRGHQDYAVPAGERFYVISVFVGEYTVNIGLLSANPVNAKNTSARVWSAATFYFEPETIAKADKDTVLREIDQWFVPEGRSGPVAATAAPATTQIQIAPAATTAAGTVAGSALEILRIGMTREEVLAALGKPQREITFETQAWMHYPGMVVLLRNGKVSSVEQAAPSTTAGVGFRSDPSGAEILVDGQVAGTTPATLQIPAGKHQLSMRLASHTDWVRDVMIFAGSETQFEAKF